MDARMLLTAIAAVVLSATAMAQPPQFDQQPRRGAAPMQRTIQTTGTAEVEAEPDQVCIALRVHQYAAQPGDTALVPMATVESEVMKQLAALGISKDAVKEVDGKPMMRGGGRARQFDPQRQPRVQRQKMQFDADRGPRVRLDSTARRPQLRRLDRRCPAPMPQCKQYEIVVDDYAMVEKIENAIDSRALGQLRVTEMQCSKIDQFRQEAQVAALANATTDARALVGKAGGELGEVMSITVSPTRKPDGRQDRKDGKIKVTSTVTVTFAIK